MDYQDIEQEIESIKDYTQRMNNCLKNVVQGATELDNRIDQLEEEERIEEEKKESITELIKTAQHKLSVCQADDKELKIKMLGYFEEIISSHDKVSDPYSVTDFEGRFITFLIYGHE